MLSTSGASSETLLYILSWNILIALNFIQTQNIGSDMFPNSWSLVSEQMTTKLNMSKYVSNYFTMVQERRISKLSRQWLSNCDHWFLWSWTLSIKSYSALTLPRSISFQKMKGSLALRRAITRLPHHLKNLVWTIHKSRYFYGLEQNVAIDYRY